jgi:hypothetical protein
MSYADLITQAIKSSADQRLTLAQIYEWLVKNVSYFREKGDSVSSTGWKVRKIWFLQTSFPSKFSSGLLILKCIFCDILRSGTFACKILNARFSMTDLGVNSPKSHCKRNWKFYWKHRAILSQSLMQDLNNQMQDF